MENNNMNYAPNYGVQPGYQQMGYDPNAMYYNGGYQPMVPQQIRVPQNTNALSDEEIKILETSKPKSIIDLNIDRNDCLRAMCTHKKSGRDVTQQINDGTGDVWCPICGNRWNPNVLDKDAVSELVGGLINQMENDKWVGDLPVEVTRNLFTLIPLLKKYPDVHEFAMNNFDKYYSQNSMINAQDSSIYAQYNNLFGPGYYNMYQQPMMPQNYAQVPGMDPNQPNGGFFYQQPQVQQVPGQNPYTNPMQAVYGVNPQAPNQQFVQQANMMMQQPVYGQPQMQQPIYGQPQMQQTPATAQQPTPYAPQATTPDGATITNNGNGTATSTKKIDV